MRSVATIALCLAIGSGTGPAFGAHDGLVTVCNGGSITVSYSAINPTSTPVVQIWRRNLTDCGPWTVLATGFALPGQQLELQAVDADVAAGKLYRYSISPDQWIASPDGHTIFEDFAGCGNTIVSNGTIAVEADGATVYTWGVPCPGSCYPTAAIWSGVELVADYEDGDPVTISGSLEWTQHLGWVIDATAAQPGDCTTIGVETQPWTSVKQMYR